MRPHWVVPLVAMLVLVGTAHAAPADEADPRESLEAKLPQVGDRITANLAQGASAASTGAATATTGLAGLATWMAQGVTDAARTVAHVATASLQALLQASHVAAVHVATLAGHAADLGRLVLSNLALAAHGVAIATATAAATAASLVAAGATLVMGSLSTAATAVTHGLSTVLGLLGGLVAGVLRNLAGASPEAKRTLAAGAAGATGTAAAWAGWRELLRSGLLAPMYSRVGRDELLDHDVRRAIFDHVREHPGVHVSALADAVDVGWGTVVYHLERLESARLLTTERRGNHKCIFVNGGDVSDEAREAIPALKSERAREVLSYLTEHPAASQKQVGEALEMSPALVSWHVGRLADAGLVTKERVGRGNVLHVEEETAAPALAATA